jgi:Ca2+-binding RTX toxin-like protein
MAADASPTAARRVAAVHVRLFLLVLGAAGAVTGGAGGAAAPVPKMPPQLARPPAVSVPYEALAARAPVADTRARAAGATILALAAAAGDRAGAQRPPIAGPPAAPGRPGECAGRTATVTGTDGNDDLYGTPGRDVVDARGGDDWIRGLGGNDLICAGAGNDLVFAGGGDDVVHGQDGNDLVEGHAGADWIDGGPGAFDAATFWSSPAGVVGSLATGMASGPHGTDTFLNVEGLHGSAHADSFHGGAGSDDLLGLGGDDVLDGGPGNDGLQGFDGDDVLRGGEGNDWLNGDAGDDAIDGGGGTFDAAVFGSALSGVFASLESNIATGGAGNDTLAGVEVLFGGPYGDELEGSAAGSGLAGGPGDDVLRGGAASEFLSGDAGDDEITGGDGNDWMQGGPGDDELAGRLSPLPSGGRGGCR